MTTQDLTAITLGLFLSGMWLMYKLNKFQWIQKINDPKGVVIPSFIFLLSPFLAVWIMPVFTNGSISEIVKPIVPLITFILGQAIMGKEKQKENKKQKTALATMIIYNLEANVIGELSRIEGRLMESIRKSTEEEISDEIQSLLKKSHLEMEKLYEKLNFQLDIIEVSSGIGALFYIEKIIKDIERMESFQLSLVNKLHNLSYVRLYIIEGYERIIDLIKESIPDNESIRINFLDGCISKLNQERKRLIQLRRARESMMSYWKNKPQTEWREKAETEWSFTLDIDPEGEAIRAIETLLQRLGMPITTIDLNSTIGDFETSPTA